MLLFLLFGAGTLIFMFFHSASVVAPLGAALIVLLTWSFIELGRSRLVDWRLKRMRWFVIPVLLFILGKIWAVLA